MVRFTDRPDMTIDVYRGRKTTIQQLYNRGYFVEIPDTCLSDQRYTCFIEPKIRKYLRDFFVFLNKNIL